MLDCSKCTLRVRVSPWWSGIKLTANRNDYKCQWLRELLKTAPYEGIIRFCVQLGKQTTHPCAPSLSGAEIRKHAHTHTQVGSTRPSWGKSTIAHSDGGAANDEENYWSSSSTITSLAALGTHQRNGDASTRLSSFSCISGSQCTVGRSTVTSCFCRRRRVQAVFTHWSIMKSPVYYTINPPLPEAYNKTGYSELFRLTSNVLQNFYEDGQRNGHFRAPDLATLLQYCPSVWSDIGLCLVGAVMLTFFRVTLGNSFMNVSLHYNSISVICPTFQLQTSFCSYYPAINWSCQRITIVLWNHSMLPFSQL